VRTRAYPRPINVASVGQRAARLAYWKQSAQAGVGSGRSGTLATTNGVVRRHRLR